MILDKDIHMKYYIIFVCFLTVLFTGFSSSAQIDTRKKPDIIIWDRYASAWVQSEGRDMIEQRSIKENAQLVQLNIKGLQLYIPDNPYILMPNGNKFIQAYLINNTKDSVTVDIIDATVNFFETEIKSGESWKLFQKNMGSSCGNSYYKMQLAPGKYLSLQVVDNSSGSLEVPYRIAISANGTKVVSNETKVHISEALLNLAGTPIKDLSL
jgi:hypothetical protein